MCDKLGTDVRIPRTNTELCAQYQRLVYKEVKRLEKVKANFDDTLQWVWLGIFQRHMLEKFWAKALGFPVGKRGALRGLYAWEVCQYLHIKAEVWEDLQAQRFAGDTSKNWLPKPLEMKVPQNPLDLDAVYSPVDIINLIFRLDDSEQLRIELQVYDWGSFKPLERWGTKASTPALSMLTGYLMRCVGRNVFLVHRTLRRKNQDVLVKCTEDGTSMIALYAGYMNPEAQAEAREALYRLSAKKLSGFLCSPDEVDLSEEGQLDDVVGSISDQQGVEDLYLHLCSSDDTVDILPLPQSTTTVRYAYQSVG